LISVKKHTHIIVGLSGGPDSVFLLHKLKDIQEAYGLTLTAAHLNHEWRPESNDDEKFCKTLCQKLGIPLVCERASNLPLGAKSSGSKEALGRKLRRYFFERLYKELGADYIALAHHQQDQQETFFLRLIRGCSLEGLTGIKPVNGPYIRPLLQVSKQEILHYLHENDIEYCIDKTNESDEHLRNRIRKHVLPMLHQVDDRFDKKFQTTLDALIEENELLQALAKEAREDVFAPRGDVRKFMVLAVPLQKRVIIEWLCREKVPFTPSTGHLEEIMRFLSSDRGGTHQVGPSWKIVKKQGSFWIEKTQ